MSQKKCLISPSLLPFKSKVNDLLRLRDGILLCKLLGTLEHKQVIFEKEPKTKAACLMNLRKAFNLLREKKGFDYLLLDEINEEVFFEGKTEDVERILTSIKKFYKKAQLFVTLDPKEEKEIFFYENYMQKYVLNKKERAKMLTSPSKIDETCF